MNRYQELSRKYIQAVQSGKLRSFVSELNEMLERRPMDYMPWLFVARAYASLDDMANATNSYMQVVRLSDPSKSASRLSLEEAAQYALQHDLTNLLKAAEKRAGVSFTPSKKVSPAAAPAPAARPKSSAGPSAGAALAQASTAVEPGSADTAQPAAPQTALRNALTGETIAQPPNGDTPADHGSELTAAALPAGPAVKPSTPKKKEKVTDPLPDASAEAAAPKKNTTPKPDEAPAIPQNVIDAARSLLKEGIAASNAGKLDEAASKLKRANQWGIATPQLFYILGQTLQRMQEFDDAIQWLDKGIKVVPEDGQLQLINLKAQIFSTMKDYEKAALAYEELLLKEKRPPVRRFSVLQLARIYRQQKNLDRAREVLQQLIDENPEDVIAQRLIDGLNEPDSAEPASTEDDTDDDDSLEEFRVHLPDRDLISPMLMHDLQLADFRDENILRKGGVPDVSDADRLLYNAEQTIGSEFYERYPLFLEAAKAYSRLDVGSYKLGNYYRALARYAMLKGGAITSEFHRQITSPGARRDTLRHLRDSASSYYLEALAIQAMIDERIALVALTNQLRTEIMLALFERGLAIPPELDKCKYPDLFRFCNTHPDPDIVLIPYASMVAWGAASGNVWNNLQTLKGSPSIIFSPLSINERARPYEILSKISGLSFSIEQKPGDVLSRAFLERRKQQQEVQNQINRVQVIALTTRNLRDLYNRWQEFSSYRRNLTETDVEIMDAINEVLAVLLPYPQRSPEERTAILFSARTRIDSLQHFIRDNPTYWGRVAFEVLLNKWKEYIFRIESKRLKEIQPRFDTYLDPPFFYSDDETVTGGVSIRNVGLGTADRISLCTRLYALESNQVLFEDQTEVQEEIQVNSKRYVSVRIPVSCFQAGLSAPYRLVISITPSFRQESLDSANYTFTVQIGESQGFSYDDIPWDQVEIPPKHMFKGREALIARLVNHLKTSDRNRTVILFGLTRTGKSSILRYLAESADLETFFLVGKKFRLLTFTWLLPMANTQSKSGDMWSYLLGDCVLERIRDLIENEQLSAADLPVLKNPDNLRFKDWEAIIDHLISRSIYPVFLVDEFTYYRQMVESRRVDASFLAVMREFAIGGKASFVLAGTYDLKALIRDKTYGITGQFVNAIETQISQIDREPAIELIQAMNPVLEFTPDAVEHILNLSYQLPYFIQYICKNCARYASNSGRRALGFPEVEAVVQAMINGQPADPHLADIELIPAGLFMNNMDSQTDSNDFRAAISTLCDLTRDLLEPRMVSYTEIQEVWDRHKVPFFRARLAKAVKELTEREVLIAGEDEGVPTYRISVDLFRRWWAFNHKFLEKDLDQLMDEGGDME